MYTYTGLRNKPKKVWTFEKPLYEYMVRTLLRTLEVFVIFLLIISICVGVTGFVERVSGDAVRVLPRPKRVHLCDLQQSVSGSLATIILSYDNHFGGQCM